MYLDARRLILITFTSVTLISVLSLSYTFYMYVGTYTALRMINVSIQDMGFTIIDSTHATVYNNLSVYNPSKFTFVLSCVHQEIYVNGQFMGEGWRTMYTNVIQLTPLSNVSILMLAGIKDDPQVDPDRIVSILNETTEKSWHLITGIYVDAPIIGNVWVKFDEDIQTE